MQIKLLLVVCVVILLLANTVDGKRRSKTKKIVEPVIDDEDEDSISFTSSGDLTKKLNKFKEAKYRDVDEITPQQMQKLADEEAELRKNIYRAVLKHGEDSIQKANALHALGRNVYRQNKNEEGYVIAKEIVRIHELVDGPESEVTSQALSNLGVAAAKAGHDEECSWALLRGLHILLKTHSEDSKEVLMYRGRLLTYHVDDAEHTKGISYKNYLKEL